ncbi:MAG: hypothetical protein EXR62_12165 [Chloroflexi bacterium]|nr:hypothetical protein [Chloroflexota bacterium]
MQFYDAAICGDTVTCGVRGKWPGLKEDGAGTGRGTIVATGELPSNASVLVGVINRQKDLAIVYQQGWYRLPVRYAPRYLAAEYLALYQTRRCPPHGGAINLLAPILRYALVTRGDLLPEEIAHPRSHELYYRLELGPVQYLSNPVAALRQKRMAFITTTIGRLLLAQDLADLWQHTARQVHLQQTLMQQPSDDESWLYEGHWLYRSESTIGPRGQFYQSGGSC